MDGARGGRTIEELLAACGVDHATLGEGQRRALDDAGYLILDGVADAGWLDALRAGCEACADRSRPGTVHTQGLALHGEAFERVFTHPRVLACVHHVLARDFVLLQLEGRAPSPGHGAQGLHTDWTPRAPQDAFSVVTAIWMLDDFRAANGATRVVPGSHLDPRPVPRALNQPGARHPNEVPAEGGAGSVLVLNGHLWHAGGPNRTDAPRRALQCQFVARDRVASDRALPTPPASLSATARRLLAE